MSARSLVATLALVMCGTPLRAQVGTTPDQSPFRDVEKRQDVTLLFGPSIGGKDRAGAAPRGGLALGLRYDVRLGGSPLAFTTSIMRQAATRDILQPGLPLANRIGSNVSQPLYALDAAFTLLLTGSKSWHSLLPSVTAGVGIVTDNKAVTDSSQFKFGNRFAPVVGLGVKYAPLRSRWTVRADLTNRFYSVPYPATFRDSTPGAPRIVGTNVNSSWTRNTMLTLGLVREIGRR
ncbi:MAG: hypothetical protein U5K74_14065 [Gemmatimonadaceae bacterium]|nr:hypothetical protein [Gemmatimonadaceae bacterium]